jgi:hypothetical protein
MCVVSNIGDSFGDKWKPFVYPEVSHPEPIKYSFNYPAVSVEEFEALKKEVKELKELLLAAKKFDEATGQPDCHMDEKVAILTAVAEAMGVDLSEIFGKKSKKKS